MLAFEGLPAGDHALTVTNGDGAIWIEAVQVQGTLLSPAAPMLTPTPAPAPLFAAESVPVPGDSPSSATLGAQATTMAYEVVSDSAAQRCAEASQYRRPLAIYLRPGLYVLEGPHTVTKDTYLMDRAVTRPPSPARRVDLFSVAEVARSSSITSLSPALITQPIMQEPCRTGDTRSLPTRLSATIRQG